MAFEGNTWVTYLIFSFIAIVAMLGNALVLYVLVTRPSYLKHPYNLFIFSLAATDIITAVMLVFSRYLYLPSTPRSGLSREVFCKTIWSAWVLFTLGYISIYTCVALTIERWLAVAKPHLYRNIRSSQVFKALFFVWMWGITINLTTLFRTKFSETKDQCSWTSLSVGNDKLPWLDFTLQSIIPFTTMVILYCHILYTMKKLRSFAQWDHAIKKVTKVALAASSAMVVGWLPSRVSFMLSKYRIVDPNSLMHYCLVMMSFANSCVNPFLYGIYSSQFRKEYKKIYSRFFLQRKPRLSFSISAYQNKGLSDGNTRVTPL